MKTKLTLIVMEVFPYQRGSVPEANVLVDVDGEFPSEFVSTKNIPETLSELCSKAQNITYSWLDPLISDLYHEAGSTECEAIYTAKVQNGMIIAKNGYEIRPLHEIQAKEKYARSILSIPRTIG
jgi:hypothetical protein